MWKSSVSEIVDLLKHIGHQMTYQIHIPLHATIEIEIESSTEMNYGEILSHITEVDLKEASLHLPVEQITGSFIRAVAKNNLKINAITN